MTVRVKRGDVGIVFRDTLTDGNGNPINLTGADVKFLLRARDGEEALSGTATIENATEGEVAYTTADGDLDVAGFYRQEWEVTYGDGSRLTVPSDDWNDVQIMTDLNPEADGS